MNSRSDFVDAGFALLDRQIIDGDERPFAKVDDVEYGTRPDGGDYVTALLCGPGAWGPRVGGRPGRWIVSIWARLHPDVDPQPVRIPMAYVASVGHAVKLNVPFDEVDGTRTDRLDDWFDVHIINRLPGARHEP